MRAVLLVAGREFRQVVRTRGFWISLLALPIAFALMFAAQRLGGGGEPGAAYMLVDASGRHGEAVRRRIEVNHQRQVLLALARYEGRFAGPAAAEPARRWYSDADVEAFLAAGGLEARLAALAPSLPPDAPAFEPPSPPIVEAAPPAAALAARDARQLAAAIRSRLGERAPTAAGPRRLTAVIFIPPDFGATGSPARIWNSGAPSTQLIETVRGELSRSLRAEALAGAGVPPAQVAAFEAVQAPLAVSAFERAGRMVSATLLPLGAAYLLLMSMLMSGSLLLQGVMEERSNRLLEAVLACVTAAQLMYGKLLGLMAVGLIMISVWAACAIAGLSLLEDSTAGAVRQALSVAESPWLAAAVVFYFFAGQLMYSALFLAVGAMSESMQDAQSYLTPIMLLILLPFMLLMSRMVRDPDGLLPTVLPWIPIYTPFAMLARLGQGVTPLEAVGTTVLLAIFVALELWLLGRLFRRVLLRTGQSPRLAEVVRLMGGRGAD